MDQPSQMSPNASYPGHSPWVDMGNSYPASGISDYGAYPYSTPTHGLPLPSESLGRSMPPPTLPPLSFSNSNQASQHHAPHSLPPPNLEATAHHQSYQHPSQDMPTLVVSSNQHWPTMLAGDLNTQPTMMPETVKSHRSNSAPSPRKMLTDDDRRRMCLYHQKFPWKKQTEIGSMFGVERSTVSKVLRKKEKYLTEDDMTRANKARPCTKADFIEIERQLAGWANRMSKRGTPLKSKEIISQAQRLMQNMNCNSNKAEDGFEPTPVWADDFKIRYGLIHAPVRMSPPQRMSPRQRMTAASNVCTEAQRMSISHLADPAMKLAASSSPQQSATSSQTHGYPPRDATGREPYPGTSTYYDASAIEYPRPVPISHTTSFSESATEENFTFSPDSNVGAFMLADSRFLRPRSQTCSVVDIEQPMNAKYHASVNNSPVRPAADYPIDPQVRRMSSHGSLYAHSPPQQSTAPGIPDSPSVEDTSKALDTLLSFAHKCSASQSDIVMIVRFFRELGIHSSQNYPQQNISPMTQMPEADQVMVSQ
ncbi:hypothetical protein BROUX41_003824 [Berkeleyomyces rouxiae]|uniref:uncharacterized protein n=1 Tax=Berkeleyomyces rouxiae TaxID=2035830 RepID=UPI003B7F63FF